MTGTILREHFREDSQRWLTRTATEETLSFPVMENTTIDVQLIHQTLLKTFYISDHVKWTNKINHVNKSAAEMLAAVIFLYPTCEWVDELWRLHIVQVGGSVPRSRHDLFAPHQPIGSDHHALMAAQSGDRRTDRRTVVRTLDLAVGLVFVWKVHVVFAGCLLHVGMDEGIKFKKPQRSKQLVKKKNSTSWRLRWCQRQAVESAAGPCTSRCELSGLQRLRRTGKKTNDEIFRAEWVKCWCVHTSPSCLQLHFNTRGFAALYNSHLNVCKLIYRDNCADFIVTTADAAVNKPVMWPLPPRTLTGSGSLPVRAICSVGWNLMELTVETET